MTNSSSAKYKTKAKLVAAFVIGSFLTSYLIVNARQRHDLKVNAKKLDLIISEPIEWIETISIHMGRKIVEHGNYNDLKFIDETLRDSVIRHGAPNRIISWSMFSWGDRRHQLMVNSMDGIKQKPEDLLNRQYTARSSYNPWSLQITKSGRGVLSNMVVLPVSVGISDDRDQFQGSIISGINVKSLLSKAEMVVDPSIAFFVVNRDVFHSEQDKVVLSSSNSPDLKGLEKEISSLTEKLKDWVQPEGKAPNTIRSGVYTYDHYRNLNGYQLAIIVGFNRLEFWFNVVSMAFKMLLGILIFCFVSRELNRYKR